MRDQVINGTENTTRRRRDVRVVYLGAILRELQVLSAVYTGKYDCSLRTSSRDPSSRGSIWTQSV